MGCVIFQCYPYGLANANAENFNEGRTSSRLCHGFNCKTFPEQRHFLRSSYILQHFPTIKLAHTGQLTKSPHFYEQPYSFNAPMLKIKTFQRVSTARLKDCQI